MWALPGPGIEPKSPAVMSESCSVVSNSLQPHGLYSAWNFLVQNTEVGSLACLQGIFLTQESNPGLPHCRQIDYQLSHKGSPRILEWVAYPFCRGSSWPRNRTRVYCIAGGLFHNWAIREAPKQKGSGLNDLPLGGYQVSFKYGIDWTQYNGH